MGMNRLDPPRLMTWARTYAAATYEGPRFIELRGSAIGGKDAPQMLPIAATKMLDATIDALS